MRFFALHSAFAWFALRAFLQAQSLEPPSPAKQPALKPDAVLAIVNGQKFTYGEWERLVATSDAPNKAMSVERPESFLRQYAMFKMIVAEAEKNKLDAQSPQRERIADARRSILIQARVDEKRKEIKIPEETVRKHFEDTKEKYQQTSAKVIYISRLAETREVSAGKLVGQRTIEETKAKVGEALKRVKAGEEFAKVAKELSDDQDSAAKQADMPAPVRASSESIPAEIRKALLSAKTGDIVGPLEHASGFYIFKVTSVGLPNFEQVKDELTASLREAEVQNWANGARDRSTVEILKKDFFVPPPAPAAQQNDAKPQATPSK